MSLGRECAKLRPLPHNLVRTKQKFKILLSNYPQIFQKSVAQFGPCAIAHFVPIKVSTESGQVESIVLSNISFSSS